MSNEINIQVGVYTGGMCGSCGYERKGEWYVLCRVEEDTMCLDCLKEYMLEGMNDD